MGPNIMMSVAAAASYTVQKEEAVTSQEAFSSLKLVDSIRAENVFCCAGNTFSLTANLPFHSRVLLILISHWPVKKAH